MQQAMLQLRHVFTTQHRRRAIIIGVITFTFIYILFFDINPSEFVRPSLVRPIHKIPSQQPPSHEKTPDDHPIDKLIHDASLRFETLLSKRSFSIQQAAAHYRERRGRHPPPGFDVWFEQAQKDDAIIVEEFFDRIHHDINPFWALKPKDLRMRASSQPQMIQVRDGKVDFVTDDPTREPWIQLWTGLVKEMMPHLPDLDMVINHMDETRILVPWETINAYVQVEEAQRHMVNVKQATSVYSGLKDVDEAKDDVYDPGWFWDAPKYWDHFRLACPPNSPSRNISALPSFDVPVDYPNTSLPYMFKGFISNFTQAQDACLQPHLRGMHGTFIESVSMSTTRELFPMFGGSKLPQNNEILIPGAMYLSPRAFYNGGKGHGSDWQHKKNSLIWRGTASGGRHTENNWWHYHRHRWVQMMNGTTVSAMEAGNQSRGPTFSLLPSDRYSIPAQTKGNLGEWLSTFSDVAFVFMECSLQIKEKVGIWPFQHTQLKKTCPWTAPYMHPEPSLPMKKQYEHKYLPDVDGNSFSARWRAFLQSTSMPLKSTIYTEWHDDRIIPWVHFVPFDNSFGDIYAIMDYFLNGHDKEAEMIAMQGKRWVDKVYRREDMKLYVWRLLLEYARVVDDNRDYLAFVKDLE